MEGGEERILRKEWVERERRSRAAQEHNGDGVGVAQEEAQEPRWSRLGVEQEEAKRVGRGFGCHITF